MNSKFDTAAGSTTFETKLRYCRIADGRPTRQWYDLVSNVVLKSNLIRSVVL